jgi:hypothetical protein
MKREIPDILSHLEMSNGYPVPFVQMYIDGKPDFPVIFDHYPAFILPP